MQQRVAGTIALIVVVLAAALGLTAVLGIFPVHDPDGGASPSTTSTTMAPCPPGPTPTTAGVCGLPNGGLAIVP